MASTYWKKIDEIFPLVAELPTEEREERLRELCAGDERLRREIAAMLSVEEEAKEFIETPVMLPDSLAHAFSAANGSVSNTLELVGRKIGAYRVVRKLGAGGMGAVYLAERADGEFRKRVAIKLVKSGADSSFNLRRFRHERQILAALEHPNIARLLDGGTTDGGSPFFVMEYVEGKPLFDYCADVNSDLRVRMRLFRQVLSAVGYAHEHGVVHRDIKPGNILVARDGAVRLLDFGIAKILDPDLIHDSVGQTDTLFRQMTPEYASPEQICGEEITTASDVYSLGVVLYELLTGERPYKFTSRAPHEIARVICEQEVKSLKSKIIHQNVNSALLDSLEKIVLKALRKKPLGRYGSVSDFDRDIERALDGLPVLTDGGLEFLETVKENAGAASVSLAVTPFQVLSVENKNLRAARDSNEFLGIGLADALTTKLSGVRRLMVRPTSSVLPLAELAADDLGKTLNVDFVLTGRIVRGEGRIRVTVQLLKVANNSVLWAQTFDESETDFYRLQDSISERVATSLVPHLTAEDQEKLYFRGTTDAAAYEAYLRGRVFLHNYTVGGMDAAENCFEQAIAHDPDFALAHCGLADFYNLQTIFGLTSNEEGFTRAKKAARRAIELDAHSAEAHTALAFTTWAYDWDFAAAEQLFQKALKLNPNYARAHEWYSFLLSLSERHEEAAVEMQRAERLDPQSPAVASMHSLIFYNARRYEESLAKARRALELDPDYYIALQSLGWICPRLGRLDEAVENCRRAVRVCDRQALNKFSLALALIDAGQTKGAREIASELETRRETEIVPAYYLALVYACLGEDDLAFEWFDRAIEERGYYTLRMRVEPRLDRLRGDARFARLLERIKPLSEAQTIAVAEAAVSPNVRAVRNFGKFKNRALVFASVFAALVLAGIYAASNFISGVENVPAQNEPAQIAAQPGGEPPSSDKPRTSDPVADELYQAGTQQLETRSLDGVNRAIKLFTEATRRDPNFALAFSGLADAHIVLADKDDKAAKTAYRTAEEYALKALALDPDLAEARTSLAMTTYKNTGNSAAAEKHFLRAIEINPKLARAHHWYSQILRNSKRDEEALREIKLAAEIEPRSAILQFNAGIGHLTLGNYREANAHFDRAIELDSNYTKTYLAKAITQQMLGDYDAAVETYRIGLIHQGKDETDPLRVLMQAQAHAAANRREPALTTLDNLLRNPPAPREEMMKLTFDVALVYALLGDAGKSCEWLGKVEKVKIDPEKISLDPRLANLKDAPCFTGLVDKWKAAAQKPK